ncbi:MAG: histone deacetylase family protein [Pseudomonadota bacterium]
MATAFFTDAAMRDHVVPDGHVERPARWDAVTDALSATQFEDLVRKEASKADWEVVEAVHDADFVDELRGMSPTDGLVQIDPDTYMGPASLDAALYAAGAAAAAVDAVVSGEAANAFCATRPPGHHAERRRAMGFGLFNTVAIGAHHARNAYGAQRVAVVDFDVHHGNGTQDIFWDDPDAFYASTHEHPQYPGTGMAEEIGAHNNVVNVPLPSGTGSQAFRAALEERVLPTLRAFRPDFVFISAGFDAHAADPLGGFQLVEDDFAWATTEIAAAADDLCNGRVVSVLEGGYDLAALGKSAAAHVSALMRAAL